MQNYNVVPNIISGKDLDYLSDMFNWNYTGYKELYKYFDKEISLEGAISLIKKNSRHYAKRQYTWFNNQMDIKWFETNYQDFNKTVEEVTNYINKIVK